MLRIYSVGVTSSVEPGEAMSNCKLPCGYGYEMHFSKGIYSTFQVFRRAEETLS